jgi:hypothetical protein
MRADSGALDSQSRVDRRYGLCWQWVCQSLGRCANGLVSREMLSREMGVGGWGWSAHTSGLGGVTKNPQV